jgi:hypothetical protein
MRKQVDQGIDRERQSIPGLGLMQNLHVTGVPPVCGGGFVGEVAESRVDSSLVDCSSS